MKIAKSTILIGSILLGLIINESIKMVRLNNDNKKLRDINNQYSLLVEQIDEYKEIKTKFDLINDKRSSIQENIDDINKDIEALNNEIDGYKNKINWLNGELSLSK